MLRLTLPALLFTSLLAAQPGFQMYYRSAGSAKFNLIEQASGNFFVAMGGAVIVDMDGNPIHNNYYWGDSILNLQAVAKYSENEFYFVTGFHGDSCNPGTNSALRHIHAVVGIMDSLGVEQDMKRYVLPGCQNLPSDLVITSNKEVVTWGRSRFFALKVDSNLTPLWSKRSERRGAFQFIRELPGGDLLVGINMDTAGAAVARLDPAGNYLWCKSYVRPNGMVQDCVVESDSTFIITGYTDSVLNSDVFEPLPPGYHPKLFMMKLNGAGEVQWCKGYDSTPIWHARYGQRIVKAQDGGYVVLANIASETVHDSKSVFLMKTNANGDTLWTRTVGANGFLYQSIDLLACSDGGFLFNGTALGNFWPNTSASYIFKSDSLGHLACSEIAMPPITVSDLFPTDSNFTFSTIEGAVATPISVIDTVYGPLTTFEACTLTTVRELMRPRKLKVRPNPNNGRFNLDFKDPLQAESWYSVYDALGKLLFQRPLGKGKETEEIDLSRYGKGTFVIKCTDPTGVYHERVVVE